MPVHRRVGPPHQLVQAQAGGVPEGHTDAAAEVVANGANTTAYGSAQVGHAGVHVLHAGGKGQHELVAAPTGRNPLAARGSLQRGGYCHQDLVADLVAKTVVDGLEAVKVDEQQGQHRIGCQRGLDCAGVVAELAAGAQAGQPVHAGQLQRPVGLGACGLRVAQVFADDAGAVVDLGQRAGHLVELAHAAGIELHRLPGFHGAHHHQQPQGPALQRLAGQRGTGQPQRKNNQHREREVQQVAPQRRGHHVLGHTNGHMPVVGRNRRHIAQYGYAILGDGVQKTQLALPQKRQQFRRSLAAHVFFCGARARHQVAAPVHNASGPVGGQALRQQQIRQRFAGEHHEQHIGYFVFAKHRHAHRDDRFAGVRPLELARDRRRAGGKYPLRGAGVGQVGQRRAKRADRDELGFQIGPHQPNATHAGIDVGDPPGLRVQRGQITVQGGIAHCQRIEVANGRLQPLPHRMAGGLGALRQFALGGGLRGRMHLKHQKNCQRHHGRQYQAAHQYQPGADARLVAALEPPGRKRLGRWQRQSHHGKGRGVHGGVGARPALKGLRESDRCCARLSAKMGVNHPAYWGPR